MLKQNPKHYKSFYFVVLILQLLWYFLILNYKACKYTPQKKPTLFLRLINTSLISLQAMWFMDIDRNSQQSHTIVCLVNVITIPINKGQKSVVMKSINMWSSELKEKKQKNTTFLPIYHANILKERIQYNAYYKDTDRREQFSKVLT